MYSINLRLLLFLCCLIFVFPSFGQNKKELDKLVSSFIEYSELSREIGYVHLNKTTLLKGEILGFTAYVLDKTNKKLSSTATNIYCTLSNAQNKVIKSKMLLGDNGVANGSFQIDSLFTPGDYKLRVYTNWMKNFDEQNYFVQAFKIMDSDDNLKTPIVIHSKLDVQFLPEGGHFIEDIKNSIGVIVKDSLGFGVSEVSGKVVDSKNNTPIDFQTNKYGIGKFTFIPKGEENYKVMLHFENNDQTFPIAKAEPRGIALTMNEVENRVALSFRTNNNTLKEIKRQHFTLAIHNGNILKTINVSFGNLQEVIKIVNYEDLYPGINIFTLFDENNQPILERLFFKYEGINFLNADNPRLIKSRDSLNIKIPIKNIDLKVNNNFSISILPTGTKSYNPNNNIVSATYLQPYIRSYVEDASYYFTDITRKKKFELDNVLLTQGWSSYDWNTIFNNPPKANYEYENGISFKANANDKAASEYMMYASVNNEMQLFHLDDGDKDFGATGLYPMETEKIRFSAVKKNKNIERPNLYLQFFPSRIPDLNKIGNYAPLKKKIFHDNNSGQNILQSSWDKTEKLDEVVVKAQKTLTRQDRLTRNAFGSVDVLDDLTRKSYSKFSTYIRTKGFLVYERMGSLIILNPRMTTTLGQDDDVKRNPVRVYLDDMPLMDLDILYNYPMDDIDYVFYVKSGADLAGTGPEGVIKIYTDQSISRSKMKRNISQNISAPLTFSSPKKFYVPEYSYSTGPFYRDYGVIDWFPKLSIDKSGNLEFTIITPEISSFSLFIEGATIDGRFISEKQDITIE